MQNIRALDVKVGDIVTWRALNGMVTAEVQEYGGQLVCVFPNGKMIAVSTLSVGDKSSITVKRINENGTKER